ncbi:DUF1467 family protein [Shinella zoogloeoides]|jgi:predicted secreted protein|uniref:DUF1467 family protein n=1 Tax=Shinella zoogloeoides TaxID=352475 RepID=A0A6N8TA65_SHIZO|nr:DUF1467 family protein [Shinella zoogloeoides]MXN99334.1 DUF1467 family protein [Shinella zoogloeoides]UEX82887.1 DUF1467 family protein [Shinella zoogloeoides]
MQLFSYFAVYFIVWWMTLFAILPLGLKTQAEAEEVVPGTVESAPARFRGGRVVLLTTIVSALLYGAWYILSVRLGLGIDAIPQIMPDFK